MKVCAADITEQFDLLIGGRRSREEVEAWAEERRRAEDQGGLEYEPPADEAQLWSGITYLMGVALKVAGGGYLHSPADFEKERRATGF